VKAYKEMDGKWLVTDMSVADNDSTASLQMCFKNFSFTESPQAQRDRAKEGLSLAAKRPLVIPAASVGSPSASGGGSAEDADIGSSEEVNN
ncbi:MAG: hypothetical protein JWM16_6291, partial [Verrucomicrobiales bacterium]|nr:hypothetical protein [Verrucomicrobiales bacterium]